MSETLGLAAANLASPQILFLVLGAPAVLVRSNLAIPREVTSFLALCLMLSIGFHEVSSLPVVDYPLT